jgi:predicted RNase H-like HicB family nuclease
MSTMFTRGARAAKLYRRIYKHFAPGATSANQIFSPPEPEFLFGTHFMRNEFTAVIERDGDWFVAWPPEISGTNGQGRSVGECRESRAAAIRLILGDRPEDRLRVLTGSGVARRWQ